MLVLPRDSSSSARAFIRPALALCRSYYVTPEGNTAWGDALRASGRLPAVPPPTVPQAEIAKEPELPHGWTAHYDVNSGYYYYTNKGTGETTWTRPVA